MGDASYAGNISVTGSNTYTIATANFGNQDSKISVEKGILIIDNLESNGKSSTNNFTTAFGGTLLIGQILRLKKEYGAIFYDRQRRQAALDYLSPVPFARNHRQGRYASAA